MLKNHNICLNFAVYYEMFVNKITTNANNFQSFYNDESNWPD